MHMNDSAQIQIEVKLKRSSKFIGQLTAQEFELESISNNYQKWPVLSWNGSVLKTISENEKLLNWTDDVSQNLKNLQRGGDYTFHLRVLTHLSNDSEFNSTLSHTCKFNQQLETSNWPCGINRTQYIPAIKVLL